MLSYLGKEILIDIKYTRIQRSFETLFGNPKQDPKNWSVCVEGVQDVGEVTAAFWFLVSSSVKWECSRALNDTLLSQESKSVGVVQLGACAEASCCGEEGSPIQPGSTRQASAFCSFVSRELEGCI